MIRGVNNYCFKEAVTRSQSLITRYAGGTLPDYNVDVWALAHYIGFRTYTVLPNNQGIELIVHKTVEDGLAIEYHPHMKDLEFGILYAVALEDLGFLKWESRVVEYNWGSVVPEVEKLAATLYANELLNYCVVEEVV
jgi:hypothetical protein